MDPFIDQQKDKLLWLRDALIDSIALAERDHRESEGNRNQVPGFSGDPADVGTAVLEQEFVLQMLSQGHDALVEINDALRRIECGVYGVCEACAKAVPRARLEAIPFTRLDVECQAQVEKRSKFSRSRAVRLSLSELGLAEENEEEENALGDPAWGGALQRSARRTLD